MHFMSELQQMVADGVLSELVLCESRPTDADAATTATAGQSTGTTGGDNETPLQAHQQKCHRPQRVYDALRQRSAEVADFLMPTDNETEEGGLFYACGDVKNMSRELWACLSDILQREKGFSPVEAIQLLKKLREKERLIEDVWS
ncbi:hypothetical protein niasHS_006124 [Heterodera schachtii]|uniref:Uncharacterized protein n=1 Tax=Heterodera schachtii TaxID=97005 RepID=A0ABD2JW38_HETSC